MKRAVALSMAMLATGAVAGEKKTYNYICNGRRFTVTAVVDAGDVDRWSKTEPVILQIGTEPPPIPMRLMPTATRTKTMNSTR